MTVIIPFVAHEGKEICASGSQCLLYLCSYLRYFSLHLSAHFSTLIVQSQMYHIAKTMPLTLKSGINGFVSESGGSLLPGAFCL
jgi:hypothetical protein